MHVSKIVIDVISIIPSTCILMTGFVFRISYANYLKNLHQFFFYFTAYTLFRFKSLHYNVSSNCLRYMYSLSRSGKA